MSVALSVTTTRNGLPFLGSDMSYTRETTRVLNKFQASWNAILVALKQMEPMSLVRPSDSPAIFKPDPDSQDLKFLVGPVVLCVPEKPNHPLNLFIVLAGWIRFGPPSLSDPRQTTVDFGTQVGYFRSKDGVLYHVYGAHYDMDETLPGHPVFHAQVCSQTVLTEVIRERFNEPFSVGSDFTQGLLRNVRTPTAQMDVFSVITQIGADHLLTATSNSEVQSAFKELREACDFFVGAAGRLSYLSSEEAARCYRSTHWYGRPTSEAAATSG
jgi:hypothetical protein